jgi:hypothetical protein
MISSFGRTPGGAFTQHPATSACDHPQTTLRDVCESIYVKLGSSSRTQLARVVRQSN